MRTFRQLRESMSWLVLVAVMANLTLSVLCCMPRVVAAAAGATIGELDAGGFVCRPEPGKAGGHGGSSGMAHCLLCPAHATPAAVAGPDLGPAFAAPVARTQIAAFSENRSRAYWTLILGISSRGPPQVI